MFAHDVGRFGAWGALMHAIAEKRGKVTVTTAVTGHSDSDVGSDAGAPLQGEAPHMLRLFDTDGSAQ